MQRGVYLFGMLTVENFNVLGIAKTPPYGNINTEVVLMYIYKIENKINGMCYIGRTKDLKERIRKHKREYMSNFFDEFGFENFEISVVEEVSEKDVYEKEIYYIELYNSLVPNGYNRSKGGISTLGYKHTEEAKKKMSLNRKPMKGENNHFFGKKHSVKTREKMKKAWKEKRKVTTQMIENLKKGAEKKKRRVRNIETGEIFEYVKDAAKKYSVAETNISRACRVKTRTVRGYHFEYID